MIDDAAQRDRPSDAPAAFGLRWSIRRSLLEYVSALPDGQVRVTGGADVVDGYHFLFPAAADAPAGRLAFRGRVELTAHFGALSFAFEDPWLQVGATGWGAVSIATQAGPRIDLAVCGLRRGPDAAWCGTSVALTHDGATLLADYYPPGTELDPFTAREDGPR